MTDLSNVNLRTIQRLENNKNEPRGKTLLLICKALDLNIDEIMAVQKPKIITNMPQKILHIISLSILNLAIAAVFGFLTLDSAANWNSKFGAFLLSIFLGFFIAMNTPFINGIQRVFKFGLGSILYLIATFVMHGFVIGFTSGLFICLITILAIFFYGGKVQTYKNQ